MNLSQQNNNFLPKSKGVTVIYMTVTPFLIPLIKNLINISRM